MATRDLLGFNASAGCPYCGTVSQQIHDRYDRHPTDLPWSGWPVHLVLRVRRFRCPNPNCARHTFAEDFSPTMSRRGQRTADSHAFLFRLAWMLGGEAGARIAHAAGLPVSPSTLLRLLRRGDLGEVETPRVLGIDDLALRWGQR